jgi:hypothetical protein
MKTEIDVMSEWIKTRFEIADDWDCRLLALDLLDHLNRQEFCVRSAIATHTVSNWLPGNYQDCLRQRKAAPYTLSPIKRDETGVMRRFNHRQDTP